MCGRFTLKVKPADLEADPFHAVDAPDLPARYNVAPSQPVAVIRPDGGVRRLALGPGAAPAGALRAAGGVPRSVGSTHPLVE